VSDNAYEESNDTLWRATPTGLTQKNHGIFSYFGEIGDNTNLLPEDDVDLFKFDLGLGERVRIPKNIELFDENDNFPFTNAEVKLFDETGQEFPTNLNFLFTDPDNYEIYEANQAGTFYVGISSEGRNYDPSYEEGDFFGSTPGSAAGNYRLTIETIGREMGRSNGGDRLFAVKYDDNFGSSQIVELNPATGEEINSFLAPETFSPGPQGLAFDGDSLFFLTSNGPTTLWELDPDTGAVREDYSISNFAGYDGLAVLDQKVYILDNSNGNAFNSKIIEFDPANDAVTNTLFIDGVEVNGGLAAIKEPNALLGIGSNSQLLEINPTTGEVTNSFFFPGLTEGVAVVDDEIYVSYNNIDPSDIEVFDRSGIFQRTLDLPYSVSALGGDDVATIQFEEPNDTLLRATHTGLTLTNPGTFQYFGEIGDNTNLLQPDDVDLFKFDLDEGETVRLPATIDLLSENDSLIAPAVLQLFDSTGTSIPLSTDPEDAQYQIYQASETGTFYVGISGNGNTNYNPNIEGSGSGFVAGNYDLTIETTGARTGDETNDIRAEAIDTGLTLTNSGVFNYSGEIGDNVNVLPENDVDLFKFDLDIGEQVKFPEWIDLIDENGALTPASVKLFDANGVELFGYMDPDDPNGMNEIYRAENGPQTLYLGVSGFGTFYDPSNDTGGSGGMPNEVGSYDLTIETVGRSLGDDETNDILAEAVDTGLTLTNSGIFNYAGKIGDNVNVLPENDVDLFKFDIDIGEKVKFPHDIELVDENGFINLAQLELFDASGNPLFTDMDPDDFNSQIYRAENGPETLYIGVSGFATFYDPSNDTVGNGGMSGEVGSYDLTIETVGRSLGDDETND
ncbi:MAG: hypothetical protein WBA93_31345, partial [Microcoleaceae cyanobacterium]